MPANIAVITCPSNAAILEIGIIKIFVFTYGEIVYLPVKVTTSIGLRPNLSDQGPINKLRNAGKTLLISELVIIMLAT